MNKYSISLLLSFIVLDTFAQSRLQDSNLLEDINRDEYVLTKRVNTDTDSNDYEYIDPNIYREQLKIISPSKKIFLITNSQNKLNPGDFFSILINNRLVARALVAKEKAGLLGIKILKIYSLARWSLLKRDMILEILVGDDTHYINRKWEEKKEEKKESEPLDDLPVISDETDLYNDSLMLQDDIDVNKAPKGAIANDNIISVNYGLYREIDIDNTSVSYEYRSINWSYQFQKNLWFEGEYGQTELRQFPEERISTVLNLIGVRLKYSLTLPLHSYLFPYVGYKIIRASSPSAGDTSTGITSQQAANELALLEIVEQDQFIVGATLLRRLVPGWFFRINLGTDNLSLGLAIEF